MDIENQEVDVSQTKLLEGKWLVILWVTLSILLGIWIYLGYVTYLRTGLVITEHTAIEKQEELKSSMSQFYILIQKGAFDQGVHKYEEILLLSDDDVLTGKSIITSESLGEAQNLLQKSNNEQDRIKKSQNLLELGKMMYEFWNTLYYSKERERYGLAILYYYSRAITTLDSAIAANPRSSESYRYRGVVLADIWILPKKTISDLKQAIALNPHDTIAYYKLWNSYRNNEQYTLAVEIYLSGLTQNPKHELMRNNLGITYFDLWDRSNWYATFYALAKDCKEFCNIANYTIANNLAQEDGMKGREIDLDEVKVILTHLDIAIEKSRLKWTMYRDAYSRKGEILSWVWRDAEAIKCLTLSLNDPNDYEPYNNSFNQNTSEDYTYYLLWRIYKRSGNKELAEKYVKEWLLKYPEYQNLKELWEELIDYNAAEDEDISARVI